MNKKWIMRRWQGLCLMGLLLLSITSCGGKFFPDPCKTNCTPTNSGDYLYVANSAVSVSSIGGFTIANNALTRLSNSPYGMGVPPNTLAITPSDKYLYAGSIGGYIYAYAVNSNGTLSVLNSGQAVAQQVTPVAMQVDPTGKWLLMVDAVPEAIVFAINSSTGALTTQGNPVPLHSGSASHLLIAPNGKDVFVSLGTGGVDILTLNAGTGVITGPVGHLSPKSSNNGDQGLAVDPNSAFLFVTETGKSSVRVFTLTNDVANEISGSPFTTGVGPSQVLVTADGGYVYVANRTDNTISGFSLGTDGTLTELDGSPYAAGKNPVDLVEDKTDAYIGVANAGGSADLQVFSIDATTGDLTLFGSASTGTDPVSASAITGTK